VNGFGTTGVKGTSTVDNGKGVLGEASGNSGAGVSGVATHPALYGVYGSCEYRWQRGGIQQG